MAITLEVHRPVGGVEAALWLNTEAEVVAAVVQYSSGAIYLTEARRLVRRAWPKPGATGTARSEAGAHIKIARDPA
ncbi:hypothetical protein [Tsukamurella pseudospumae]|uniref:Uncharacterized protein n=1 Tax=Tsukamurella pseudospumae TaxID=239498 RepID=A0A138AEC2_9ACTN|nr:hypothetical protein [Tsukamurella pseudospumae]KXP08802.1 hypothetical protein AXK60_09050 [Tsukamurella pseudospumae]